ncbi:hypothetical protein MMF93_19385 [Streptomyces tubbatahanensis]|uniref:TPM domain-containing protein n=1 Tax=Streptomyces tubbatahanensis TaxID=2923272 RepID=A0ABY3XV82_9ACTN|nr:hypothetical protein [Streptomyces tubbatahanensis]UNS98374.1 hypothetical protein MMF93_19385 [Streptomyces tubbatahanensis]
MCPTSPADRGRRAGAGVAALSVAALSATALGSPAHAWAASPQGASGDRIAAALRSSPVHVADSYRARMPRAQERALERRIAGTGLPLKVVLMPFTDKGGTGPDAWSGSAEQFAAVMHEELARGGEEFILLTNSGWDDDRSLEGHEWPDEERYQARYAAWAVGELDSMRAKGFAARFSRAVDLTAEGNGMRVYEKAREKEAARDGGQDEGPGAAQDGSGDAAPSGKPAPADGGDPGVPASAAFLAGGASALVLGVVAVLWRRARRAAVLPAAGARSVFATARGEQVGALRERAREEVVGLGEDVSGREAADGGADGVRRALDAYEAATTVLDAAEGLADLAGALALVEEGRAALRAPAKRGARAGGNREPLPLCFFHPLHGRGVRRIRWRPLGQRDPLRVAACRECAEAVRARRPPEVLRARDGDSEVPYFEIPPERSLWAATGYGSLTADPLAVRVQRGDFTRAAANRARA